MVSRFTPHVSFPLIRPHQLPLRQEVAFHRGFNVFLRRAGLEVEHRVEGVELKKEAMGFAGWRTRPAITQAWPTVQSLLRIAGNELRFGHVFRKSGRRSEERRVGK